MAGVDDGRQAHGNEDEEAANDDDEPETEGGLLRRAQRSAFQRLGECIKGLTVKRKNKVFTLLFLCCCPRSSMY